MSEPEPLIENELLDDATLAEVIVTDTKLTPTSADDNHVRIEGRLGREEDEGGLPSSDVEHYAFAALALLSSAHERMIAALGRGRCRHAAGSQ